MNPWQEDLEYFIEWMLLGEASRTPSGRGFQPFVGAWILGGEGRVSDLRLRRFVCISALAQIGKYSIDQAAAFVAGKASGSQANVIRVGYYEVKARKGRPIPGWEGCTREVAVWFERYLFWRYWVVCSPEEDLRFSKAKYRERYSQPYARRLQALTDSIRRDGDLIKLARICIDIGGPPERCWFDCDIGSLRELAKSPVIGSSYIQMPDGSIVNAREFAKNPVIVSLFPLGENRTTTSE
jgi:hypothetical protein